jgi:hypothetical protein
MWSGKCDEARSREHSKKAPAGGYHLRRVECLCEQESVEMQQVVTTAMQVL